VLKAYFLLLSMLKKVVLLNMLGENMVTFFSGFFKIKSLRTAFEIEIFSSIIKCYFTVTFDQFNASLLNKITNLIYI